MSTDFTTRALPFYYLFIQTKSIFNSKVRLGRVCDLVFLNSVQYLFHVNNLSRNQKVLRPCVALSLVQVQSLSSVAKQSSLQSFVGSFRSLFKVGPVFVSNFQSFPRGQSPPLEKNYYSFSLYCLIQTVSLFKNILGFLSKGGKNYKKNIIKKIIKNGTLIKKEKILCIQCQ